MSKRRVKRQVKEQVHAVKAYLWVPELTKAGYFLLLRVSAHGETIGKLEIGQGSLYWTGRFRKKSKRIDWSKFADMMDKLAYEP